jgi:hypothetical protein
MNANRADSVTSTPRGEQGARVIVCGGRWFTDVPLLFETLDRQHQLTPMAMLAEGASDDVTGPYVGADYWARIWAVARGVPRVSFHADWKTQFRAAGPIRNKRMLDDVRPSLVVAFEGGRGTDSMVSLAEKTTAAILRVSAHDGQCAEVRRAVREREAHRPSTEGAKPE